MNESKGLRWVKASERLPEKYKKVAAKRNGHHGELIVYGGDINFLKDTFDIGFPEMYSNIFWLDEGHEVPCRDGEQIVYVPSEGKLSHQRIYLMDGNYLDPKKLSELTCRDGVAQEWNKEKILAHWKDVRTKALSFMLDNPYSVGLYRTSDFFKEIDTHFENMLDLALTTTDGQKEYYQPKTPFLVLKKYETYLGNVKWHINTNEPKGKDLEECNERVAELSEMITDLKLLITLIPNCTDGEQDKKL